MKNHESEKIQLLFIFRNENCINWNNFYFIYKHENKLDFVDIIAFFISEYENKLPFVNTFVFFTYNYENMLHIFPSDFFSFINMKIRYITSDLCFLHSLK